MEMNSLVQIFGSAGVTFYVMWLWLQSIQTEKRGVINKLETEQENRIKELKEMLPLLNDASKGLQDVIKSNEDKNKEVVQTIINHIDEKTGVERRFQLIGHGPVQTLKFNPHPDRRFAVGDGGSGRKLHERSRLHLNRRIHIGGQRGI